MSAAYESVSRLGKSFFKNGGMYVEKYVTKARHLEVQLFGDGKGTVAALGVRECSVQRRNQKVIEETRHRASRTQWLPSCLLLP